MHILSPKWMIPKSGKSKLLDEMDNIKATSKAGIRATQSRMRQQVRDEAGYSQDLATSKANHY